MINLHIEILIGAILITIYAHERFNTPPNVRASTTAIRYYVASAIYLMIYLITFYLLTKYPFVLGKLNLMKPEEVTGATPIIVAMVLSMLVPKIPLASTLDTKLKLFLHRLAAIPFEAIRLSKELQACDYKVPGHFDPEHKHVKKLFDELKEQGYEQPEKLVDAEYTVITNWINITSLMIQVKSWESKSQFSSFVQERAGQLDRIKDHYARLSSLVQNAYLLNQEMAKHKKLKNDLGAAISKVTSKFDEDLQNEQRAMYSELCDFISHGLLKTCIMGTSRIRTLNNMGFADMHVENRVGLSVNSTLALFGILLILTLVNFILFQPKPVEGAETVDRTRIMLMVTMIVAIYSAAVICAVVPKQLSPYFQASEKHSYPGGAYVMSGLLAMCASFIISMAFRTLLYALKPEYSGFVEPFQKAWEHFSTSSYPWLIMAFVCTLTLAFLIDWQQPKWIKPKYARVTSGVIQASILVSAVSLVHWWLTGLASSDSFHGQLPPLVQLIRVSTIIGFVLGFFVPAWYTNSTRIEAKHTTGDSDNTIAGARLKRVA